MANETTKNQPARRSNTRVIGWCLSGVVGMFAFGFALVPLYEVFCEITGINGKTGGRYEAGVTQQVDDNRTVRVQFLASNGPGMTWEFRPVVRSVDVHPGEVISVNFYAANGTDQAMVGQAVPSLSPSEGTQFFHKTECFCFNQQPLEAGESVEMPLIFIVDRDLPEHITKLTLSYTLYDQGKQAEVSRSAQTQTTTNNNG
ncbi:cytochrome c oxidase assembly protein [Marinobacter halophilus]|uniref:Cytochrome c oxidase assembly protein CtaG n=1 Tax=Marinobacter halophilus TaxID=1323740 RepID=A0A2T1KJW2_9GAMM|nr:cytochrome c oxidase assembly protein [Marinobacter halophilus]PSF10441.1 cytochrome c oxidase assembly protein [Marinobacter halophilus]GGC67096.1 cytochrome c oxidase assembly protein [Marinobacter halophilus]